MQEHPALRLFNPERRDDSVWHGRPMGLHSFGHQQLFDKKRKQAAAADMVDTAATGGLATSCKSAPSFCHCTIRGAIADAINVWVENQELSRDDYERVDSRWYPSHLSGTWQAEELEIKLAVTVMEDDRALIRVDIVNNSSTAFAGRINIQGDEHYVNAIQAWYDFTGTGSAPAPGVGLTTKKLGIGYPPDVFPFFRLLAEDRQVFDWHYANYRFVFALDGDAWSPRNITLDNGYATWLQSKDFKLEPGRSISFNIGFAGEWTGRTEPNPATVEALIDKAKQTVAADFAAELHKNNQFWQDFFRDLPIPSAQWSDEEVDLYYKAWTCVYYNVWPQTDMVMYYPGGATACCNKVCSSTFIYPATWEDSLAAVMLSLCKPDIATQVIASMTDAVEEDGYLAEAPGSTRSTQLACVEPMAAWMVYTQSGDKEYLRRIYEPLRRNLLYRFHFANWRHMSVPSCRNYSYCTISAMYMVKMAEELGLPQEELDKIKKWHSDGLRGVDAFWDDNNGCYRSHIDTNKGTGKMCEGTGGESLIPIFPGLHRPEYQPRIMELIRSQFLNDDDILTRAPKDLKFDDTFPGGNPKTHVFSLKESNLISLLPGMKAADRTTFERVAHGVVRNIAKANDFSECYTLNGECQHNGPGSIFGAFGVIWSILMVDGVVDDLYDLD